MINTGRSVGCDWHKMLKEQVYVTYLAEEVAAGRMVLDKPVWEVGELYTDSGYMRMDTHMTVPEELLEEGQVY